MPAHGRDGLATISFQFVSAGWQKGRVISDGRVAVRTGGAAELGPQPGPVAANVSSGQSQRGRGFMVGLNRETNRRARAAPFGLTPVALRAPSVKSMKPTPHRGGWGVFDRRKRGIFGRYL
jgi:hypothetical protein